MSMVALVVTLDVKPEHYEKFLEERAAHAGRSLSKEEGCVRFDILLPKDGGTRVMLYELYADQAALDLHAASDHIAYFRDLSSDMVANREIVYTTLLD